MVGTTVVVANRMAPSPGPADPVLDPIGPPRVKVTSEPAPPATPPSLAGAPVAPPATHQFERVIARGRVIDPESGYDAIADVGIDGGRVTAISAEPLQGAEVIDAADRVVAPGFIDILSYEPYDVGVWNKVADGVTTNLGMHGMNMLAEHYFPFFEDPANRPPVHHGGAFDNPFMRQALGMGAAQATADQLDQLRQHLESGFEDGWLGLDVEPEYTPWVTTEEIVGLSRVAAEFGLPVFFHARYSSPDEAGKDNATAIAEVLRVARETGVAVHVDHITSTGGTYTMDETLATLEAARAEGLDVTACMYPYDFWATYAGSARFAPGWQERFRISYEQLYVPGTGQQVTAELWPQLQAQNTLVAAYAIPEEEVRAALRADWIMLGSDAILEESRNNHPRASGTFARTLGHYVRDEQVLSLRSALAKMTILPARRLQDRCPDLTRKGRLQIGADADITVFDPDKVIDKATIDDPSIPSEGIDWVLVLGAPVKTPDGLQRDVRPGVALRSTPA